MKKSILFVVFLFLATVLSVDAQDRHHGSVGAPLDGGLLTVLGAAGIAYYVSKKKKKDPGV